MTVCLGVDTGGTYTDAVLIRDEREVIAKAKALTTRHDLAEGIGNAVSAVLLQSGVAAGDIAMAALSTTLATNALVEGQGARVGLVLIGFSERDLAAQGLGAALKDDPHYLLAGGHDHAGRESAALDVAALRVFLADSDVSAYAVAGRFSTRNPAHELAATDVIRELTGCPVSASHQLSAKLGGPKRAVTALFNARLIGLIDELIARAGVRLQELGIAAPLMVVRGDGALMGAEEARRRPIETILSGPAASLVGARWLTQSETALVSDIGGTTTDVALLREGRPALDPDGAKVGAHRTMVEAVRVRTFGLGGDSEVVPASEGLSGGLTLGPRRVVPVSLLAAEAPEDVLPVLRAQLQDLPAKEQDGRFVRRRSDGQAQGLEPREAAVFERITRRPQAIGRLLHSRLEKAALDRLVSRGLVQVSAATPSDAAHVLGLSNAWHREAAELTLQIMAARRGGDGRSLAGSAQEMAARVIEQLERQTEAAFLECALAEDGFEGELADHPLVRAGLAQHSEVFRIQCGLGWPIVGLGASAATYYPKVARGLHTQLDAPEHGDVANAIGAVVGQVTLRRSGSITSVGQQRFRVHLASGPETVDDLEAAFLLLEADLTADLRKSMENSMAQDVDVKTGRRIEQAEIEGRMVFVEAEVAAEATGRPPVAS